MPVFMISPCGTSLFTGNAPSPEERSCIGKNANKKEKDINETDISMLKNRVETIKKLVIEAAPQSVTKMSAELHAIVRFYDFQMDRAKNDQHTLITTDTWLGRQAGNIVANWLRAYGSPGEI